MARAEERITQMSSEEWQEVADAVTKRSDYQPHNILNNLKLVTYAADIDIPDKTVAARILMDGRLGNAGSKLHALATCQLGRFDELQKEDNS